MIKPLYMLADSQLLFWKDQDCLFLSKVREQFDSLDPKAAYVGASNGDDPEFYALFQAAMAGIEVPSCRMIPSSLSEDDKKFLIAADLLLLAGGDVEQGWDVFEKNGLKEMITQKRYDGAVLVGVSAGAVQLGMGTLREEATMKKIPLFQFAPFYIGVHDEGNEWWNLRALVNLAGDGAFGVGIPAGGGLIYGPDGSLAPIRKGLTEFRRQGDQMVEHVLLPETPGP